MKRALLQFTPESMTPTRWLDPGCSWMRFVAVFQLVLIFQVVELNTFFVKHIFPMPAEHPICLFRLLLNVLIAVAGTYASMRYYNYRFPPPPQTPVTAEGEQKELFGASGDRPKTE